MPRGFTTVRSRLTAWYTGVLALPLIALAVVAYVTFERTLVSRTDRFIGDALTAFERELQAERRYLPDAEQALRTTVREVRFRDLNIVILDATGRMVTLSEPLDPRDGAVVESRVLASLRSHLHERSMVTVQLSTGAVRLMARPLDLAGTGYTLAGAYPLREVDATLDRIRAMFLLAIPLLVAAAATGGYFLAKRSLAPITAIASRAAEISASTLHERLPATSGDELGELARVLNALFDRLDASFTQQRRFMADASHELRTPTAIIRAEADVTLARDHRSEAEYRESLATVQNAAQRLSRVVDDLLFAARADAGQVVARTSDIYLEDVVHDAMRAVRPLADARGVTVELTEVSEAPCHGDADLLGRVLLNLLDNALKHAPSGTTVSVSLTREGAEHVVRVVDAGPGIPEAEWERIFERFVRLDPARGTTTSGASSGTGLGLGIARRIADLHGGSLRVASSRPGRTEFRLALPA